MYIYICTCIYIQISDTPLIDHLVMREFVSGPPSYRFIYERVRDRKPSLRKGSNSLVYEAVARRSAHELSHD